MLPLEPPQQPVNLATPHETIVQEALPDRGQHRHRRLFVGPMPEKVISQTQLQGRSNRRRGWFYTSSETPTSDEVDASMSRAIKDHAFKFFLHHGGKAEDWGENEERNTTEDMIRRWKSSEWGKIWSRKEKLQSSRWVGSTFEIGSFLGVSLFVKDPLPERTEDNESSHIATSITSWTTPDTGASTVAETSGSASYKPLGHQHHTLENGQSRGGNSRPPIDNRLITPSSSTALLRPPIGSSISGNFDGFSNANGVSSPSSSPKKGQGKRKLVSYADISQEDPAPAPPSQVLERQGSTVNDTSAGATVEPVTSGNDTQWGEVVIRDRMLVRFSHTRSESLGPSFDEAQNRVTRHLRSEQWAEYMVVWRKDFVELYDDWGIPGKEWFTGHKHLAFVVPLKASATRLSIYSYVDLTFCLTCPPTSTHRVNARSILNRARDGTNIFVFKVKSRTRAVDWTYQLWRQMGGQIPPFIEVRNPTLDTRVKIEIPSHVPSESQKWKMFSRGNIIALCTSSLRSVNDWDTLIQQRIARGETIELAWRMDTYLDWIWHENDVDGKRRDWAVLAGLALRQGIKVPHLEIRMGEHSPKSVLQRDGKRLNEPPGIEGYLDRIKPNSQTKQEVYLCTHDGCLFSLAPTCAHPPAPPGIHPHVNNETGYAAALHRQEVMRGAAQIMEANGVCDLRSILVVRRAFHLTPQHLHQETGEMHQSQKRDDNDCAGIWAQTLERTDSDDGDMGGDEALAKAGDKPKFKMKRCFELLLKSGHVIRFEAHSRHVALEWIERLRALIYYWSHLHVVNAREEMDLAQGLRPPLTPRTNVHQAENETPPKPPVNPGAYFPALSSLYNWCVLDGCKAIVRGGKVFARRGLYGQYKLTQLFLVSGQLVRFQVSPDSSLHHRRSENIHLMDAYVCSGYFAALSLPSGQYNPTVPGMPRRYQDGLEADDPEEDVLFMVWYHPHAPTIDTEKDPKTNVDATALQSVPTLSAKRKLMVFRTRSRLERDSWCWALNCEIEKIVRRRKAREEKLRETGGLVEL